MRQDKKKIYNHLLEYQNRYGGYAGKDLDEIARIFGLNKRTLKRNVEKWSKNDPLFSKLKYIGQRSIPITLDEITLLNQRLKENITCTKQILVREINDNRIRRGDVPIGRSSLFYVIDNWIEALTHGAPQEQHWLVLQGIEVSDAYNLSDARATLSNIFTYSDLKTFCGIDIDSIASRLQEAETYFQRTYLNVGPLKHFPHIRPRSKVIRNQLSRIHANKIPSSQARLIFEIQADFIVRLKDILIHELIHRKGWIDRSVNGSRQKIENRIRAQWINEYYGMMEEVLVNPTEENLSKLKELIDSGKPESAEAALELIKHHQRDYDKIYGHIEKLTNNFSEEEIIPHHKTAQVLLELCRGKCQWTHLSEEERKKLNSNRHIQNMKEPCECLKAAISRKLISYVQNGKITLSKSFMYQDIGKVIESVELSDTDWRVTQEDIEKLIEGTYPINFDKEALQTSSLDEKDESDYQPYNKIPFQQVQNQVAGIVADHNTLWFQSHQEIFEKITDHMFEMEYDELTFRTKLYDAIGFLGRNLRYSDSPSFHGLQYFIQRHLSDATLDLEIKHLCKVYENLTMHEIPLIIIDSMGIDSRRKGFFSKKHGRYGTFGFSDLRAVSPYLIPIFSCNCPSTDSEAMNIIEIINHAKSVLGEGFKFCAGNAHTVSRVAAGLAFADHKVILLGRYPHPSIKPGEICLSRLIKHLDLINKAGKLVRDDSEFGRIITSREHIFANGVDVRNLLRDLGKLILWNNEQKGYDLDDLIQMVETSNRQKRVVRIVERGVTRVTEPNVSLVLKSAELILLMSAIVNILNNKEPSKWRGMSPVSMENIALFVPA
jgi:hypothetical protein